MFPHVYVHGRSRHNRSLCGQIESAEEVVRNAVGKLRQAIRRGRGHNQQVNRLRHRNVLYGAFHVRLLLIRTEHLRDDFLSGEGRERERADKLLPVGRQDDLHFEVPLLQLSHQFSRLISGNPARDANGYFHGFTFRVLPVCATPGPCCRTCPARLSFLAFFGGSLLFPVLVGIR